MVVLSNLLNFILATAMWFVVARLLLGLVVRDPQNLMWRLILVITDPAYRVSRFVTAGRLPERWLWLVSLAWLVLARVAVVIALPHPGP